MNKVFINNVPMNVEIANTPLKRSLGLMYRNELADSDGMLFVFPENKSRSFWMKDTHIPLSIAYINEDGVIINIEDMEPLSLDGIKSKSPCKYALEVNKGWFNQNNISVGDRIRGFHGE